MRSWNTGTEFEAICQNKKMKRKETLLKSVCCFVTTLLLRLLLLQEKVENNIATNPHLSFLTSGKKTLKKTWGKAAGRK